MLQRPKSALDNATPSGNGVTAFALQRLGHLLGEPRYLQAAERTLRAFAGIMQRAPVSCATLAMALDEYLVPPTVVILHGPAAETRRWKSQLDRLWLPGALVIALPENAQNLPPGLARQMLKHVNAWVCRGVECLPAIGELNALLETLQPLCNQGETRL